MQKDQRKVKINNECYTPAYGVEPLLEFMAPLRDKKIWCPFDTEESEFVKIFQKEDFNVIYSHIDTGEDFFIYEPDQWDIIISNPPFQSKKSIFERTLSFKKPFALLMTLSCLHDKNPINLFKGQEKSFQLLLFNERMKFKGQGNQPSFSSAYFCWNFLPKQIIIRDFSNRNQLKLI